MTEYIATVLDTTGIQSYVFGSNRLRENVGASYLVEQATKQWVEDSLRELGGEYYFPKENGKAEDERQIENYLSLAAEVVYAAGGNTVILFRSEQLSNNFAKKLSMRVLREAPGLNLVLAHRHFDWKKNDLFKVVDALIKDEIERKKNERRPSVPLLGLGVTAACNSTQLVAIGFSDEFGSPSSNRYLVSREVKHKLLAVETKDKTRKVDQVPRNANEALNKFFEDELSSRQDIPFKLEFPLDVDDLGRSRDESSYVAVIHADGNNMGDRFKNCGKDLPNREYINKVRQLSWSVNEAGILALKAVVKTLVDPKNLIFENGQAIIRSLDARGRELGKIVLKQVSDKAYLPFRPLVYGGDDVTFVCDGRLGLTLAALYLQAFEDRNTPDGQFTACAGVSIAKAHYPFARSYELSSQLCTEAKKSIRPNEASALDWHIASSGISGSLSEIRRREYSVPEGKLNVRPLRLKQQDDDWQNWDIYQDAINQLNADDALRERRNKVIALREELRRGSLVTEKFLALNPKLKANLPALSNDTQVQNCGWTDITLNGKGIRACGYFDAIEAMEFYLPLLEAN